MDIFKEVQRVLGLKVKKEKWVEECLPILVEVNTQIRSLETAQEEESADLKSQLKSISDKYQVALRPLKEMDERLRDRTLREHVSSDPVMSQDGPGKLVFPETWTYEVTDVAKVDPSYRVEVVDAKKVKAAIKNGMRNIKGIDIHQERSIRVYTKAEGE